LKGDFPKVTDFMDDLIFLNKCYIPSRYPGGFMEVSGWPEAKKALEIAKEIKKFVVDKISGS